MGAEVISIRKYLSGQNRRQGQSEGYPAPSCDSGGERFGERRRTGTARRVLLRPDPAQWSDDELLALHEAVELFWPQGPVTVSSLRTAIAAGDLAHARIAGRIYTTRAALKAMATCRTLNAAAGGVEIDWDAHLATLLPGRRRR